MRTLFYIVLAALLLVLSVMGDLGIGTVATVLINSAPEWLVLCALAVWLAYRMVRKLI